MLIVCYIIAFVGGIVVAAALGFVTFRSQSWLLWDHIGDRYQAQLLVRIIQLCGMVPALALTLVGFISLNRCYRLATTPVDDPFIPLVLEATDRFAMGVLQSLPIITLLVLVVFVAIDDYSRPYHHRPITVYHLAAVAGFVILWLGSIYTLLQAI